LPFNSSNLGNLTVPTCLLLLEKPVCGVSYLCAFLAIGLLPYLKSNIKRIYVDTSSISFLVSIAIQLSNRFTNKIPFIESFESYSVFNKPFSFHDDEDSLVVISATTSGGLAEKLTREHTFNPSNIVTLFYSNVKEGQQAIFNILDVVGKITSVKPADCRLCQNSSKLIKIEGEQFVPETPKHELLVIRKVDFNDDRQKFFKAFAAKGFLKFNTAPHDDWEPEHFFIDIKTLLNSDEKTFKRTLTKKVNKHFSKDICKVIQTTKVAILSLCK
jgi:hypothetical protein